MASTVIGAGITIEGEIATDEDIVVAGTVRGKLSAKEGVTIEHGATVEADVAGGSLDRRGLAHRQRDGQRARRSPVGRARHRQREGRARDDRRRCPVQGQRRHGCVSHGGQRDGHRQDDPGSGSGDRGGRPRGAGLRRGRDRRRRRRDDRQPRASSAPASAGGGCVVRGAVKGDLVGDESILLEDGRARRGRRASAARRDRARAPSCAGYVQTGDADASGARAARAQPAARPAPAPAARPAPAAIPAPAATPKPAAAPVPAKIGRAEPPPAARAAVAPRQRRPPPSAASRRARPEEARRGRSRRRRSAERWRGRPERVARARLFELLRTRSFERKRVVLASGRESDFFIDCKQAVLTAEGHALVGVTMLDALAAAARVRRGRRRRARRMSARERRRAHELPARGAARRGLRAQGREGPRLEADCSRATRASPRARGSSCSRTSSRPAAPRSSAAAKLRAAGYVVAGVVALVDRLEGGREAIESDGLPLVALFTRADFIRD